MSRVAETRYGVEPKVKGKILGVRQVQDRGRVQIPRHAKKKLNIKDGDSVYWVELDQKIYIMKAVAIK